MQEVLSDQAPSAKGHTVRRVRRLFRLIALGRMAERLLADANDPHGEPVYLKRDIDGVLLLRIDGSWPLSPAQARLIHEVID